MRVYEESGFRDRRDRRSTRMRNDRVLSAAHTWEEIGSVRFFAIGGDTAAANIG